MSEKTRSSELGSAGPAKAPPSASVLRKDVFYKEGEYWTVGLRGKTVRLKHSKGLAYLSYLLRQPSMEFHVLDLVGGIASASDGDEADRSAADSIRGDYALEKAGIHIGRLGDAGEVLDEQAKSAYRRRLAELREELDEAKSARKVESAEELEEEIDALTSELSRAVGLGGRSRRAASASERARQTVTKTVRGAIERIAQSDAGLGNILSSCIKTGTFCAYQPDADLPIAWEFTATPAASRVSRPELGPVHGDEEQPSPAIHSAVPFSTAQRTRFVGRENDSRTIRSAISRAQAGSGSVIVLVGGPGLGKTRLAIEMADYAGRLGFACFFGCCYERDDPFPYLPFVQIIEAMLAKAPSLDEFSRIVGDNAPELAQLAPRLRRVFPDMREPLDLPAPQKRLYLFQSVADTLQSAAQVRPLLLIIDDLHWADESTLALLNHLANQLAQHPLVIIGTCREEYAEHPALARTIEELIRLGVRPLKLSGLSRDSVAKMLEHMSERRVPERLANTIFTEADGNPFFVEEVYRHLAEEGRIFGSDGAFRTDLKIDEIDVPESVRLCIIRRLNRFSEDETRVLAAAAVIGRSFSFQLLAALSGADVDELFDAVEKAQRMAIIVPSAQGPEKPFTFGHELLRQTLLAEISIARRQRMHAKAAAVLEQLFPAAVKEYAGEIAYHLLKAGSFADPDAAIRWLIEAANAALHASAFEEARANFEAALSRLAPQDSRRRAEVLYKLGVAERGLGLWAEAYDIWDQALEIFTALNDQDGAGRTSLQLAETPFGVLPLEAGWSSKRRVAYTKAERFLAEASIISSHRVFLLAILALGKLDDGEVDAAAEAFTTAVALAEELHDGRTKGAILAFRAVFNVICLRLHDALDDSNRSAQLIDAAGPWIRAQHLLWYRFTLVYLGRVREAYRVGQELEPLATRIGHVSALSLSRLISAWVEFWKEPNLDRLEDEVRRDLDAPFFASILVPEQLANVKFLRGNWDEALRYAESVWSSRVPRHIQSTNVAIQILAKAYSGNREGALKHLEDQREMVARLGKSNSFGSWALLVAAIEGLYLLGEREKAAALYSVIRELIDTGTICALITFRFPQTIAGIAAAGARNWDVAEEHFQIAMQQAESFPNLVEQADIRRFRAMMLIDRAAHGDRERARSLLSYALNSYQRIKMHGHAVLTQMLLD